MHNAPGERILLPFCLTREVFKTRGLHYFLFLQEQIKGIIQSAQIRLCMVGEQTVFHALMCAKNCLLATRGFYWNHTHSLQNTT